jgi:hypothetical protein
MYDEVRPADALLVTKIIHFNNVFVDWYINLFSREIFSRLHQVKLSVQSASTKGMLKDAIVKTPTYRNSRIDSLIREYSSQPWHFYRETPFNGTLFFKGNHKMEYIGSNRIKRVRRLAEKVARRLVDRIFDDIKKNAESMAEERARFMGINRRQLITTHDDMINEFIKAEKRMIEDFHCGHRIQEANDLVINDVAGMKIILEDSQQERIKTLLSHMENCEIIEEEKHSGKYNATNLIVSYAPPREEIVNQIMSDRLLSIMRAKGLTPEWTSREFTNFILSGEERVNLEIIVSNYQETLESEIGHCMHEERIIEQRKAQQYRGYLAKNITYLIEYLFLFPASLEKEISELPIKLWNRYLPDYFDDILRKLFRLPPTGILD